MIEVVNISATENNQVVKQPICLCIGNFGAFHAGHLALISKAKMIAKEKQLKLVLLTFEPSPKTFILKKPYKLIIEPKKRLQLLNDLEVDCVAILEFNNLLRNFSVEQFHEFLHNCFTIKKIVVGKDFTYGFNRSGSVKTLQTTFETIVFTLYNYENEKISSSMIADKIEAGKMFEVSKLIQRYYEISGTVVHNYGNGKYIGYPTANIEILHPMYVPKPGVYAGKVYINRDENSCYLAGIYIGNAPTFAAEVNKFRIEPFLIDFDNDLYNQIITLQFAYFMRDDYKFKSVEILKGQIARDIKYIKIIMNQNQT